MWIIEIYTPRFRKHNTYMCKSLLARLWTQLISLPFSLQSSLKMYVVSVNVSVNVRIYCVSYKYIAIYESLSM